MCIWVAQDIEGIYIVNKMPSKQQETRNKWITFNFFDLLKKVLKPPEPALPSKPDAYKSSQSSSARII